MKEVFSERLRELRQERGLGQIQLAKELDVGKSVISLWELGNSYLLFLNGHSDLRAAVRTEDAIAAEVLSAFRTKHVSILRDKMINFLQ